MIPFVVDAPLSQSPRPAWSQVFLRATLPEEVVTDTELLKVICICGCQDEEDTKECACKCHTDGYCGNEQCLACSAKEKEARSKPSRKGQSRNKSSRKKPSRKKGK